jgi:acetyl-CoA acyltransferase
MRKIRDAVVVESQRTGLAKSFRGSFNLTRPDDWPRTREGGAREVPKLDPKEIDDVVFGTGFPEGPQGFNVGRNIAVMAGLPHEVAGGTVSRFCSSGLNAVAVGAHMVENESADAVMTGGLESSDDERLQQAQSLQSLAHRSLQADLHADGLDGRVVAD